MSVTIRTGPATELAGHQQRLVTSLTAWNEGIYDADNRHQRSAANDAIDTIDVMLHKLHDLRSELVTQLRRYDAETSVRVEALLARIRQERDLREAQSCAANANVVQLLDAIRADIARLDAPVDGIHAYLADLENALADTRRSMRALRDVVSAASGIRTRQSPTPPGAAR